MLHSLHCLQDESVITSDVRGGLEPIPRHRSLELWLNIKLPQGGEESTSGLIARTTNQARGCGKVFPQLAPLWSWNALECGERMSSGYAATTQRQVPLVFGSAA